MRSLLGTTQPLVHPTTVFPAYNAVTPAQKVAVADAIHADMRQRGLSPYNALWVRQYELHGNLPRLDTYWDGKTYKLPPAMEAELRLWAGHSIALGYFGQVHWRYTVLTVGRAKLDAPDFVDRSASYWAAAEQYYEGFGVKPYVVIDEPKPVVDARGNVLPLDKQTKAVRWSMQIADGVRKTSTISVGPAHLAEHISHWLALGASFNLWIVKNYGGKQSDWAGYPADVRPIVGDAEIWTYLTSAVTMKAGNEAAIAPYFANARLMGATGCLMWTVWPYPDLPNDTCDLYRLPTPGTPYSPTAYPKQPKMDRFVTAMRDVSQPPALTVEQRIADLERRVEVLEERWQL